jgi:hypothetical protein
VVTVPASLAPLATIERMFDTRAVAVAEATGSKGGLALVADRVRPVVLARDQQLPVLPALANVFPDSSLPRGITLGVEGAGAASRARAEAGPPPGGGSGVAFVGVPGVGLQAAAELGVALERAAVIASPEPAAWANVVAALVGAFDVVVVGPGHRVPAGAARRLAARARERGTVLVPVAGPLGGAAGIDSFWPESPDVRLRGVAPLWRGLEQGCGHLATRRVGIEATGRRAFARPRRIEVWLPGPSGSVEAVADVDGGQHHEHDVAIDDDAAAGAVVTTMRRVG